MNEHTLTFRVRQNLKEKDMEIKQNYQRVNNYSVSDLAFS